jgi:hypothetical protein
MTRFTRHWAGLMALALVMAGASLPHAQTAAPSATAASDPAAAVDQARKLRKEGLALHDKRDFAGARTKYQAAWKLNKSYALAANLGGVELALHLYRDAAEHLAFAVRESPRDKEQDALARVQANYQEAKQHVATLSIATDVDGAAIVINGATVGRSPLVDPIFADPGVLKLQAQAGNRISEISTVEVAAGISRDVRLTMREPAPVVALSAPTGAPPNTSTSAPPANRDYSFESTRKASDGPKLAPVLVGAGFTLAGVVAGVALGAVAGSKAQSRDEALASLSGQNPCGQGAPVVNAGNCQAARSNEDEWRTASQLSIAAYVGAGVFAAGTLGYVLLTWPKAKSQTGIAPIIGPNHGEVMFRTEF